MSYSRPSPPEYRLPEKKTIALFGKRAQLKNLFGNMILSSEDAFTTISDNNGIAENHSFKIINTPDFFHEECPNPDQQIIDFMALAHPGPSLFILAIDPENTHSQNVMTQINTLQDTFGKDITEHLVVTLPDVESFQSLRQTKKSIRWAIANENLASKCRKWSSGHKSFSFDYTNYSQDVVKRRKTALEKRRLNVNPPNQQGRACADFKMIPSSQQHASPQSELGRHMGNGASGRVNNRTFNIVLLGLSGTGKSASANTIMAAGNSQLDPGNQFKSEANSLPTTKKCEVKTIDKVFGIQVRVVDTPDFFHDQVDDSQAEVEECKKYCRPEQCVVLLVLQLGRFTEANEGILEKLEEKLDWRIRESTIILLTHGEDLEGSVDQFVKVNAPLKDIVELCGGRHHLFRNNCKDTKQVTKLIKKIPDYEKIFPPEFPKKSMCNIC